MSREQGSEGIIQEEIKTLQSPRMGFQGGGRMGGKTAREPGAGCEKLEGVGSKGINLGSREQRKQSREPCAEENNQGATQKFLMGSCMGLAWLNLKSPGSLNYFLAAP